MAERVVRENLVHRGDDLGDGFPVRVRRPLGREHGCFQGGGLLRSEAAVHESRDEPFRSEVRAGPPDQASKVLHRTRYVYRIAQVPTFTDRSRVFLANRRFCVGDAAYRATPPTPIYRLFDTRRTIRSRHARTSLGVLAALIALAGCGGSDTAKPVQPKPPTYDQLAAQVHRLATEIRWGCQNLPDIKREAAKVEDMASRLRGGASDAEARAFARRAVRVAQNMTASCP